jgi:ATP-binding cassette subfamily B protein
MALAAAEKEKSPEKILLSLTADLTESAEFGERLLEITQKSVRVCLPDGMPVQVIDLEDVASAKSESLVSGGRILATLKTGEQIPVVSYTLTHAEVFSDAAHIIDEMAKGESPFIALEQKVSRCPKCERLLPEDTTVCPRCVSRSKAMLRIAKYLVPYKKQALRLASIALVSTLMTLLPGLIMKQIIEAYENSLGESELFKWMGIWAGILFTMVVLKVLNDRLMVFLAANISADLKNATYRAIEFLRLSYFDRKPVGAIASRVSMDTDRIWHFLVDGLPFLFNNALILIGVIVILMVQNWFLAVCIIMPFPFIILISMKVWRPISNLFHRASQKVARVHMQLHESLSGIRVVKAFAREDHEYKKFIQRNTDFRDASLYADQRWITAHGTMNLVIQSGTIVTWTVGGLMLYRNQISMGEFILFNAYLGLAYGPLHWFAQINNWFSRAMAGAERIFEIMDMPREIVEGEGEQHTVQGSVEFEKVRFGYDKSNPILKEVNFKAEAGQMIGLVGHSGAGKSTTINLICRFYEPNAGRILIDGKDIQDLSLQDFRSQIGIVLQEPFLFHGTIAENIRYGRPDASIEEIMRAARAANAHDFILAKPEGYDTMVGERGVRLSGGEKQRISIARAILHDPQILIFDEATSSVDVETEKQIQEAIQRLVKGRTTFAIAHRLSTLRSADRLIVLDRGKIIEEGSHEELMAKKGDFYKLVQTQSQVNEIIGIA